MITKEAIRGKQTLEFGSFNVKGMVRLKDRYRLAA